jgi:type IV pilus assembly protein PilE
MTAPEAPAAPATGHASIRRAPASGYTLVETAIVCAVVVVFAAVALPSYRGHELRTARLDAVQALTQVQLAQEKLRAATGLYAFDIGALRGVRAISAQGRYAVAVTRTGPDSYRATASAIGVQTQDRGCATLTLEVAQGFTQTGPTAACWGR